jgi:hypothetical protein
MRECLDWFIKNRFDDISIVYSDNGDYLYDEDMYIVKMCNYELINMKRLPDTVDSELCFEIIFENEEDYTEAEIYIFEDDWIQINRNFIINSLLN